MKKIAFVVLSATILLFLVSCGTKPTDEEAPQPEPPKPEVIEEKPPVKEKEPEIKVPEPEPEIIEETGPTPEELAAQEEARKNAQELYNQILDAKKKIDDEKLASYDQKNYDAGVAALDDLDALFADESSLGTDQEAKAKEALSKFNTVITTAYKKLAKDERDKAYTAKKNADFVRAGVVEKQKYQQATTDFKDGDTLFSMQAPESAYRKYVSAKEIFTEIYESVADKLAAAATAIESAKQKVAESEEFADKADSESPLTGENIDGIEDEDEQLLEDDEFDDPKNAESDIPEDINYDGNPLVVENELSGKSNTEYESDTDESEQNDEIENDTEEEE